MFSYVLVSLRFYYSPTLYIRVALTNRYSCLCLVWPKITAVILGRRARRTVPSFRVGTETINGNDGRSHTHPYPSFRQTREYGFLLPPPAYHAIPFSRSFDPFSTHP